MKIRLHRDQPSMASCLRVIRVLQTYLDGELDQHRARRVAAHLETCRRCGLDATTYTEIKQALSRHQQPLPADTLSRLEAFTERLVEPDELSRPS